MSGPGPAARREALRGRLADAGLDALLVSRGANLTYLSGFAGSYGSLLITADGDRDALVSDGRYAEQAAAQAPDLPFVLDRREPGVWPYAWLPARLGPGRLGVESDELAWDDARALLDRLGAGRVVPAAGHVERLRERKDDAELALLARACRITADAYRAALGWLRPGLSERQVARRLEGELCELGGDDRAFEPVVAAGANGALPHHRPGARRLAAGELVLLDFGATVDGYRADMTRVVALGDPGDEPRALHRLVVAAQEAGLDALAAGVSAAQVDGACRGVLAEAGHAEHFPHGSGHGLGLAIHEQPLLRPGAAATLQERMVLTVEPGVYLPGRAGVRIEDVAVVTPTGADVLTAADRGLVEL